MDWNLEGKRVIGMYMGDFPVAGVVRLSRVKYGVGVFVGVMLGVTELLGVGVGVFVGVMLGVTELVGV